VKVSDQTNMHEMVRKMSHHVNNVWLTKKHKHICGAAIHLATTTTTS